jgi:pimeloyl-ACP methyl ester carboxylesterase
MVAIAADGDRSPVLGSIRMPTRIIHGGADPLVPIAAGHDLKAKISAAQIDVVDGMGHDLPAPLYPRFVDGIAAVAGRA